MSAYNDPHKKETVQELKLKLIEKEVDNKILLTRLYAIEQSLTWKLLAKCNNMLGVLIPPGTFGRRLYDTILYSLRDTKQPFLKGLVYYFKEHGKKNTGNSLFTMPTKEELDKSPGPFNEYTDPIISIIILTHNQYPFTYLCLESVAKHTEIPHEVIVVDNASTDGTSKYLKKVRGITYILNNENRGFAVGCNQGAKLAQGKYIIFLNNDTVVTRGWESSLLEAAKKYKNFGTICSKVLSFDGKLQIAGCAIWEDGTCYAFGRGDTNPSREIYNIPREVKYCSAACLLTRKETFFRVGGFDESYKIAYYEDADLGLAYNKHGLKNYYEPNSIIYHNEWSSSTPFERFKMIKQTKKIFMKKWSDTL
tara:strand:+ start:1203 stop:2297 length:1095 start_codon:yes stop_codon:yes gene_type:complete